MKAIVQDSYGSPDVVQLSDIDPPRISDDEVLVRVHAAGVDPGVWHLMTGLPYLVRLMGYGLRTPKTQVLGFDVAGRVEAVGRNVTQLEVGDDVFGTCRGSFAEYARAEEDNLALKPVNVSFEQAAAVPVSGSTALQGIRDQGRVEAGQRVLVIGASGGVGTFAVQIAKSFGAEVTGVCSTTKVELVRAIGADHVIDYTRQDFTATGESWDLILDTAGARPVSHLRRALTRRGTLVIVGAEGGNRWTGGLGRSLWAVALSRFVTHNLKMFIAQSNRKDLQLLKDLIESGKVTPVIDRTYPLAETAEAIRYLARGHARGKIVISVSPSAAAK